VGPDVTPGFICPVAGPSAFTDTWGAPRSGGRTHAGVDMMGARGTPLVAVGDGYIEMSYQNLGGNVVWLHADHGVSYFYAHLDSYPSWLANGQRVARGDVIGYMGDTGNPAPGAYHLHFSIYPGGIAPVNPTPTVARVC
jgi:murein DD-endopeptidase MepM/ murein hydrolase activator NlpD